MALTRVKFEEWYPDQPHLLGALKDAKNKADQLADLADVKLGKPTYISEGTLYMPRVSGNFVEMKAGGATAPAPPPISPGELKITLNVQVAYEIM